MSTVIFGGKSVKLANLRTPWVAAPYYGTTCRRDRCTARNRQGHEENEEKIIWIYGNNISTNHPETLAWMSLPNGK